jgi:hypothetical protein
MRPHLLFKKKQSSFSFPRWIWPVPGPYNRSLGAERVRGWQVQMFLIRNGWLSSPAVCSITGATASLTYHSEDYGRPWEPISVSRGAHVRIHQRFRHPANWRRFLEKAASPGCWAFDLSCEPVRVIPRSADQYISHVIACRRIPAWIVIPWRELFRDDEYAASLTAMTTKEIARFIAGNTWTFARSLSHIPHEWLAKRRCSDPLDFDRLVLTIRHRGVKRQFGQGKFVYLDFEDGWSYFSMGNTLSATVIINRARTINK